MIPSTANALRRLFEAQKRDMSLEDLGWFARLSDDAETQASNIAETLNALATSISSVGNGTPGNENLANILFGLASQSETIAALSFIGSDAEFMAREREKNTETGAAGGEK